MNEKSKFAVSVIVYVSNEDYQTTFKSLISQSIGFKENVQVVAVKSKKIDCEKYLAKLYKEYPQNVTVLDEATGDVRKAYTKALSLAEGSCINFAECGCAYSKNMLQSVVDSFKSNNYSQAGVLGWLDESIEYADNTNEMQFLKSFPKNVDFVEVLEKFRLPFMFFNYCFFNSNIKLCFDYNLTIDELLFSRVLIDVFTQNTLLSLAKDTIVTPYSEKRVFTNYYEIFRKKPERIKMLRDDYIQEIIDTYKATEIPSFAQFNILVALEWYLTLADSTTIMEKFCPVEEFNSFLSNVLQYIDDDMIVNCGKINLQLAQKYYLLRIKYNTEPKLVGVPEDKKIYFGNTRLTSIANNPTKVEFITLDKNNVRFEIRTRFICCEKDQFSFYAVVNGNRKYEGVNLERQFDAMCCGEVIHKGMTFEINVPLTKVEKINNIEFYCMHNGDVVKRRNVTFEKFSPISGNAPDCYYNKNGWLLKWDNENKCVVIKKSNPFKAFASEVKYLNSLRKHGTEYATHAFLARIMYRFIKLTHFRKVWLISDRTNRGDDNGEAFVKYLNTIKPKNTKYYFVIDKNSEEGKRMAQYAKVISPNSKKHKFLHLIAEYIISSQGNNPVVNPFLSGNIFYRDILCDMKFVFLQHGVTKDDISSWLTLYNRNIYGFIVTTNQEYQSIFDYDYFYTPDRVWLTGMPRNDLLYHDEKKYVTIMPTWRKSLMTRPDPLSGIWGIRDDFKESDYYIFYNSLFNDERLRKVAREYGYKLAFKPHPNIEPYIDLFDMNDDVIVLDNSKTYREVFAESNLMVTDYSSVAFDFAYLRKPIVYPQFDKEAFFGGGHSYTEGYFDYEEDGFGEVTYDLDTTVNTIIDYIKTDCQTKQKYLDRINNTFSFDDKDCCKRIYELLIKRREEEKKK